VNQCLLLQSEYLAAENRIPALALSRRLRLSDPERSTLADLGKRLGRKHLAEIPCAFAKALGPGARQPPGTDLCLPTMKPARSTVTNRRNPRYFKPSLTLPPQRGGEGVYVLGVDGFHFRDLEPHDQREAQQYVPHDETTNAVKSFQAQIGFAIVPRRLAREDTTA
jgi:hypothetical protein